MNFWKKILYLVLFGGNFIASFVWAHEEIGLSEPETVLSAEDIHTLTWKAVGVFSLIISAFVIAALLKKKKSHRVKVTLFLGMAVPIVLGTLYLAGSTIYFNLTSESKGPVHWHADFIIFKCGEELDLKDPEGLSNRIGSSVFHEHGDNRIHLEGVVTKSEEFSLGNFFRTIGGDLHNDHIIIPATEGLVKMENGDRCDGEVGELQVFVYQTENSTTRQIKLTDPENYVIAPFGTIPPGDCIIFDFDQPKSKTDKICDFLQIAIDKGDVNLIQ